MLPVASNGLTKAFDKINLNILNSKLLKTELPTQLVNLLNFINKNTYVNVQCNNVVGEEWQTNNGTRQGGILSPMLYAFYVNELLQTVSQLSVGCKLDGENVGIICFADDIALLAPSAHGLQVMLDCAHEVLTRLCLSVNPSKSSYIVFGKRGRLLDLVELN